MCHEPVGFSPCPLWVLCTLGSGTCISNPWFCICFPRALRVSQFLCWISHLGHTTLEGCLNLDLRLYRIGVLISHRNPNTTNAFQSQEKTKSFLGLPWESGVSLPAVCSHRPKALSPVSGKMFQLQPLPCPANIMSLWANGERQVCFNLGIDHIARGWVLSHK